MSQAVFFAEREHRGMTFEDIVHLKDGQIEVKHCCAPGSAQELYEQAAFFGARSSVQKLPHDAFTNLVARLSSQA